MKLPPLLLAGSLLVNIGCAAALWVQPALAPSVVRDFLTRHPSADTAGGASVESKSKVQAALREGRPRTLWAGLQTDDLPTLATRLRAAGFPVAVINEMLRAEIEARYGARIRALTESDPATPFWKPGAAVFSSDSKRLEEYRQLLAERTRVLRDFLLEDAGIGEARDFEQRMKFGDLPRAKLDRIQRIEDDYTDMISAVRAGMKGITLPADRETLALLAREKTVDLAAFLTPEELAEHAFRSSTTTTMLRSNLAAFEPSEAEFRTILRAQLALSEKYPATGAATMGPIREMQQQFEAQVRPELGEARFIEYQRASINEFQTLKRLAQRDNLPAAAASQAFDLRDQMASESGRIYDNASLDVDQKRAALQALAQRTREQLVALLGPTVGPTYVASANSAWLNNVEQGSAVRFDGGGGMTSNDSGARVWRFGGSPAFRRLGSGPPTNAVPLPPLPR